MRMFGRRRKLTAEETEANRVAKIAREAATMTCQCCARKHLANRGWIAHHAYQRPGEGWQTASCMGAKELPFEVDRATLGKLIEILKNHKAQMEATLAKVVTEELPITLIHSFIDWISSGQFGYKADRVERTIEFDVTRANWDSVVNAEDNVEIFLNHQWNSFDRVKQYDIQIRQDQIINIQHEINQQTKRYEGWKQTHEWSQDKQAWIMYGIEGAI